MILRAENIVKKYRKRTVVKGVSFDVKQGEIVGLLGPNGAGKSTLMKCVAGLIQPTSGKIHAPKGTRIGYLPQEPQLDEERTVKENVEDGIREIKDLVDEFNAISDKFAEPMSDDEMNALLERQGALQGDIDASNGVIHVIDAVLLPAAKTHAAAHAPAPRSRKRSSCCAASRRHKGLYVAFTIVTPSIGSL